jgi:hypothetical protein
MITVGTKSVLFGVHQFIIHPVTVWIAYIKLYGWTWDARIFLAIFVHDLGYFGKPNMDGAEGESHPEFGAKVMSVFGKCWSDFVLCHSRFYCKRLGLTISRLCVADKWATVITPDWLYFLLGGLSGEITEYRRVAVSGRHAGEFLQAETREAWLASVKKFLTLWVLDNKEAAKGLATE